MAAEIKVGDWVRELGSTEQTVKVDMLVTDVTEDGYATVTYKGMDNSPVHKFALGQLVVMDLDAEKKAMDEQSKAAKKQQQEAAAAKAKAHAR